MEKLNELTGTEKQVRFGEKVRADMITLYEGALAHLDYNMSDPFDEDYLAELTQRRERYVRQFAEILDTKTSAAWWIEHRGSPALRHPADNDISFNMECAGLFDQFIKRAFRKW